VKKTWKDGTKVPMIKGLDQDGDGDHDMDDHDMEKKKDKEEAFGNSLDDSEPETMDMDAAIRDGDDLHKKKSCTEQQQAATMQWLQNQQTYVVKFVQNYNKD
jgi:hypothetical protein